MRISFITSPAFLRKEEYRFVYSIRLFLLGDLRFHSGFSEKTDRGLLARQKAASREKVDSARLIVQSKLFQWFLNILIGVSLLAAITWLAPKVFYSFFPVPVVPTQAEESGSPLGGDFELGTDAPEVSQTQAEVEETTPYLPPQDENLPEGDWLVIPRIGVRSELQATESYEEALDTGLWRVPDFAAPGEYDLPMIVAGHRYGWKWWWKTDYWRYHSFYLLPDLQPGDIVEVISDKRKWTYEIYAGEEGSQISDYDADLILYTCKYLSGPVRFFRYARLIDLEADSQG